jgi:hypothetical protein
MRINGRVTAMGHVDDDGEVVVSPSVTAQLAHGTFMVASVVLAFILGCWIGPARGPARLRATATHQTLAYPLPVVAQPPTFAETVQDYATATRAAEIAAPRDLDLLVSVRARPEMSADEVAVQATELARRLRCKIEVHYKGKDVAAFPGMSKESFVKEYVERVEFDAGKAGP